MSVQFFRKVLAIILVATFLLTSCSSASTPDSGTPSSSGGTPETPTEVSERDDLVIIYGQAGFNSLDPQIHAGTTLASVLSNMFENMVKRTDTGFEPQLATEWTQIDPLTWEFKLRSDVEFHNGEKFNASVMKYSLDRAMIPEINAQNAHNFTTIEEVIVVDDTTLRVVTTVEDPLLLGKMASWPAVAVPPEYIEEVGEDQFGLEPIGTGPYQFVSSEGGSELTVEAFEGHWGEEVAIKKVLWRSVSEAGSRMAELRAGTADIVDNVPYDQIDMINEDPIAEVLNSWSVRTVYIQLDCDESVTPTNDVRVRQAIAYSIDVDSLINDLLLGNGRRIASYSIPEVAYHDPDLMPYEFDLDKAKELMTEAGYTEPVDLTFDITVGRVPMDKELCEAITGMLNDSGLFNVNLIINESGVYSDKYANKELPRTIGQMTLATHGNYTYDPDFTLSRSFAYVEGPRNMIASHQDNMEWDEIIKAAGVETSDSERREMVYTMQELIKEDVPRVYLYQQRATWGINSNLNWTPSGEIIDLTTISWK